MSAQGFEFGSEQDEPWSDGVIQRFDAEAIPCQTQRTLVAVPSRESKHAVQPGQRCLETPVSQGFHQDFAVAGATEGAARLEQFLSQRLVIVDFTVIGQDPAFVL